MAFMRIAVQIGVSEGRRQLMLRRWKYADRVTLLMWALKLKLPSRMTPRLFTWGDGGTVELSMDMEKGLSYPRVDLVPMRRTLVLPLFSLRKLSENHDLISSRQLHRAVGGRVEVSLVKI